MQRMQRNAPTFTTLSHTDLARAGAAAGTWLWHGYLAPGNVTLLTGPWKCGKTTLLAALLGRLGAGGVLAGRPLAPGRAVVVSEESPAHWHERGRRFGFGPHLHWLCRPFPGKPGPAEWQALIDHLHDLCGERGVALVVIDPLASFLPRGENDAASMLAGLLPLQRLTVRGAAVLLLHHPSKKAAVAGRRARGSGALSGYADILLEMDWYSAPTVADRRRRLYAFARHAETPAQQVIELSADGTDYAALGTEADAEFAEHWRRLRPLFEAAEQPLTRRQVGTLLAAAGKAADEVTLWRWLDRAAAEGRLCRGGAGRRNEPYHFWLPGKEVEEDPAEALMRQIREDQERVRRVVRGEGDKPPFFTQ